jgi:hypothetical protein
MSRPFWHYQYVKEEKLLILINDDSLKRRLAHHGLKYYNRKDAIKTLIDIEIKKEKE